MQFQPFTAAHRAACLALFDANCPDYFAPNERDDYHAFLDRAPAGYSVVLSNDDIVGACGLINSGPPDRRRVNWILVSPRAQGLGVGAAMMAHMLAQARDARVHVIDIAASHKSAAFFARFGAVAVRHIDDGWGPKMHRIDMEIRLGSGHSSSAGDPTNS